MAPVPVVHDYVGYTYALSVAAGGLMGYFTKGSKPSLVMGLLFGLMIALGAYMTSQDPENCYLSTGASGVLTAVMGNRYIRSRKLIPAGVVALLSMLMMLRYGIRIVT